MCDKPAEYIGMIQGIQPEGFKSEYPFCSACTRTPSQKRYRQFVMIRPVVEAVTCAVPEGTVVPREEARF